MPEHALIGFCDVEHASSLSLGEPALRERVRGKELEELSRDFFAAAVAGMGAVGAEVFGSVSESGELAAFFTFRPKVRAPKKQR